MGIITSLLLLILLIISYDLNRKGKIGNGISLGTEFIAYWFVIVLGGCLHLYGLYDISINVYILVILGSISFFIGYRLLGNGKANYKNKSLYKEKIEYLKPSLFFYIVLGVALTIIIKQIILLLPIILSRGMSEARGEFQLDDTLVLTGQMQVLLFYFAKPFAKASIIIFIVNSVRTKFTFKSFFIILVITIIYFLSEGGRAIIMDVMLVLFYVLYQSKHLISKSVRRNVVRALVIITLLPILATLDRGSDIFRSIYSYYCGSLQFFSQALSMKTDLFEDYLFGMASFQGFIKPFTGVLQIIGLDKPEVVEEASDFILNAQNTVYDIGPEMKMNYFYTTYGYTYKDAGVLGVILIHLIFGCICRFVDNKEKICKGSVRWIAIKATFFFCILYTMSYFPFAMYLHTMTLIYIYIITTKVFSRRKMVFIKTKLPHK